MKEIRDDDGKIRKIVITDHHDRVLLQHSTQSIGPGVDEHRTNVFTYGPNGTWGEHETIETVQTISGQATVISSEYIIRKHPYDRVMIHLVIGKEYLSFHAKINEIRYTRFLQGEEITPVDTVADLVIEDEPELLRGAFGWVDASSRVACDTGTKLELDIAIMYHHVLRTMDDAGVFTIFYDSDVNGRPGPIRRATICGIKWERIR